MLRKIRVVVALLLIVAAAPGCLGRFALSASVRKFNLETVSDKWGRECLFIGLYVIPVYPFCATADLLVVNSIEFWSGENPIDGQPPLAETGGGEGEAKS